MIVVMAEAAVLVLLLTTVRSEAGIVAIALVLLGIGTIEPSPSDAAFAVVLLVAVVMGRMRGRRPPIVITTLAGLFIAINVTAIAVSPDLTRAVRYAWSTVFLILVALWFAMYVRSERQAALVVRCLLIGAVSAAAIAIVALFVDFPGGSLFLTADGLRAKGLLKDANVFGPFLVPLALIVFEELVSPRLLRISRPLKGAALLVLVAGIAFSYSRGAWLNAAVAGVVMLGVMVMRGHGHGRKVVASVGVAAGLLAVGATAVALTGASTFFRERAHLQAYDSDRFQAQLRAVTIAAKEPLSGIGPGQFELAAPTSTHSLYARTLVEEGVPGFVVLMALVVVTLGMAVHHALEGRDTWGIGSAPLLATWCGLLANAAVIDTLHWRHAWLVAGLIWSAAMIRGRSEDSVPEPVLTPARSAA